MKAIALVLLLFGAAGCGQKLDTSDLTIELARSSCFGTCPAYELKVSGDGSVTFIGKVYVKERGTRKTQISEEFVQRLAGKIRDIDYFSFDENTKDYKVFDAPLTTISITWAGKSRTIRHYMDLGVPQSLLEFEGFLDEIVQPHGWIQKDI